MAASSKKNGQQVELSPVPMKALGSPLPERPPLGAVGLFAGPTRTGSMKPTGITPESVTSCSVIPLAPPPSSGRSRRASS